MVRFSLSWSIQLESDLGTPTFTTSPVKHLPVTNCPRPWLSPMASHCPQATLTTCLRKKHMFAFQNLKEKSRPHGDFWKMSVYQSSPQSNPKIKKKNTDLEGWLGCLHAPPGQMLEFAKASWNCHTKKKTCTCFKLIFVKTKMGVNPKIVVKKPKMDGENNGKPY